MFAASLQAEAPAAAEPSSGKHLPAQQGAGGAGPAVFGAAADDVNALFEGWEDDEEDWGWGTGQQQQPPAPQQQQLQQPQERAGAWEQRTASAVGGHPEPQPQQAPSTGGQQRQSAWVPAGRQQAWAAQQAVQSVGQPVGQQAPLSQQPQAACSAQGHHHQQQQQVGSASKWAALMPSRVPTPGSTPPHITGGAAAWGASPAPLPGPSPACGFGAAVAPAYSAKQPGQARQQQQRPAHWQGQQAAMSPALSSVNTPQGQPSTVGTGWGPAPDSSSSSGPRGSACREACLAAAVPQPSLQRQQELGRKASNPQLRAKAQRVLGRSGSGAHASDIAAQFY